MGSPKAPHTSDALESALRALGPHDHLCLVYSTRAEQFAAVVPFVRLGLQAGERCVYITDDTTAEAVTQALSDDGIDVRAEVERGALSLLTKRDSYLRSGSFDPDAMIEFLAAATRSALEDGFTALRVTGEMTWVLGGEPGTERLFEYEAKLNYFFPGHQASAICQYNRGRFSSEVITDVVRTHPLVITGHTVCRNRHFIHPDEFLRPDADARRADQLLQAILETERATRAVERAASDWRGTFDALSDHICLLDRDGMVLRCNRPMGELLGEDPGDLVGRTCYELMHGAGDFVDDCPYRRMLETGVRESMDLELGDRWYQVTADPLTGEDGEIVGAVHALRDITQSKRTEEALRESEQRLSLIYDSVADIIFSIAVTADGRYRYEGVNARFLEATGLTEEEVVGRYLEDVVPEPSCSRSCEQFQRALASGSTVRWEATTRYPRGPRIGEVAVTPIGHGSALRLVGTIRDVSARRAREDALAEETRWLTAVNELAVELAAAGANDDIGAIVARRLRQATDAVGASFGRYDAATHTIGPMRLELAKGVGTFVPRPLRRRLEGMHTPVDDELHTTLVTQVIGALPSLTEATRGLLPAAIASRLQKAAGVDRFVGLAFVAEGELYGSSLLALRRGTPDPPPELLEAFAHMGAVALRRRRTEEELRASQKRAQFWAQVVDNAGEAIGIGYPDGRLGELNRAWTPLLGYSAEELQASDWAEDLTPPEWLESERAALDELERKGRPVRYEKEYVRKDGTRVPIELLVHLMKEPGGSQCYVAFISDISERKQADAEIRRLNDDLERRVRVRTDELRAANQELQEFIYSVSHDLRTPLRAVDGFSLTVLEDYGEAIGEQGRGDLHRVRAAAQKMGELIDALLSLSRLGRREVAVDVVDLSAIARRVLADRRLADPGREVRVTIQDGLTASADPALADVILDNLLGNAWKFTAGREHAHIEFGAETTGGETVFFVRDDGAGFDAAYRDKLFQPFQRLHTAEEFPGTGIGLATVARVLGRLGGRWWADGEPDRGATFFFTLPASGA